MMGWFFGFKLYVILSEKGQIINFLLTTGNVNDQTLSENRFFMKKIILDLKTFQKISEKSENMFF